MATKINVLTTCSACEGAGRCDLCHGVERAVTVTACACGAPLESELAAERRYYSVTCAEGCDGECDFARAARGACLACGQPLTDGACPAADCGYDAASNTFPSEVEDEADDETDDAYALASVFGPED